MNSNGIQRDLWIGWGYDVRPGSRVTGQSNDARNMLWHPRGVSPTSESHILASDWSPAPALASDWLLGGLQCQMSPGQIFTQREPGAFYCGHQDVPRRADVPLPASATPHLVILTPQMMPPTTLILYPSYTTHLLTFLLLAVRMAPCLDWACCRPQCLASNSLSQVSRGCDTNDANVTGDPQNWHGDTSRGGGAQTRD